MKTKNIKKLLKQKARNRVRVSLSLDADNFKEIRNLTEFHSENLPKNKRLTISDMVDTSIEIALADPFFNPDRELNSNEEDFE